MYEIKIHRKRVFSLENKQAKIFEEVKVYAGDPWYPPVDGKIKNLWVETKGDADEADKEYEVDQVDNADEVDEANTTD